MKNILIALFIVALIGLGFYVSNTKEIKDTKGKDATYIIDGKSVTLKNGSFEENSVITKYFGNEVSYDFNKDGREDTAFVLTQSTGGSGTFYYVVAALNKEGGYVGSSAVLLGDRIAPQSTNVDTKGILTVNYADRKLEDSFVTPPSVGKSIKLILDVNTMQFGEVAKDFEGEADPNIMTLNMKTWDWLKTEYMDGKVFTPKKDKFTLKLNGDMTFSATTDCNGVGGEYSNTKDKISFTKMVSTLMFCEGSDEVDFSKMLSEVEGYKFTSKGELILGLMKNGGSMIFR